MKYKSNKTFCIWPMAAILDFTQNHKNVMKHQATAKNDIMVFILQQQFNVLLNKTVWQQATQATWTMPIRNSVSQNQIKTKHTITGLTGNLPGRETNELYQHYKLNVF